MRVVFVGASKLAVMTARELIRDGHEVVVIEQDKEKIVELSGELDCGFLHGDGSRPAILREAGPEHTDFLFCLSGNDQVNILASLIGRSLGFSRVVPKIEDPELDHICFELGLESTIIPTRTITRSLCNLVEGRGGPEHSPLIKGEARLFSFVVREQDAGPIASLELPRDSRVICYYHKDEFTLPSRDGELAAGDEVVVLTRERNLAALRERWSRPPEEEGKEPSPPKGG